MLLINLGHSFTDHLLTQTATSHSQTWWMISRNDWWTGGASKATPVLCAGHTNYTLNYPFIKQVRLLIHPSRITVVRSSDSLDKEYSWSGMAVKMSGSKWWYICGSAYRVPSEHSHHCDVQREALSVQWHPGPAIDVQLNNVTACELAFDKSVNYYKLCKLASSSHLFPTEDSIDVTLLV